MVRVFFDGETGRVIGVENRPDDKYTEENAPSVFRGYPYILIEGYQMSEQQWFASPREYVLKEESVVYDPQQFQMELREAREILRYPGGLDMQKWQEAVWKLNTFGQPVP